MAEYEEVKYHEIMLSRWNEGLRRDQQAVLQKKPRVSTRSHGLNKVLDKLRRKWCQELQLVK